MKKTFLFSFLAVLTIGYFACRKSDTNAIPKGKDPFLNEAIDFLSTRISSSDLASLDVDRYTIINDEQGAPTAVRISLKDNAQKFIMVGKAKGGLIGNWVDLSKMNGGEQLMKGELITKSFDGKAEAVVSIVNNSVVKTTQIINGKKSVTTISYENGKQIIKRQGMQAVSRADGDDMGTVWLPEVTVYGYSYGSTSTYWSLYYYFNQNSNYLTSYSSSNPYNSGGGGSGGSGSSVSVQLMTFAAVPGIDIKKFMKCFANVPDAGATYTLTLHADVPVNSNPNALVSGTTPGHAFVTFTKSNGSTSVSQVMGFYPTSGPKSIFDLPVASQTVNDGGHEYNASITVTVTQAQFNAAQNQAITYSTTKQYDLNDFNCTDYAVNVFNSAATNDISVPDTHSGGLNYGTTPNGLYQYLQGQKMTGTPNVSTGTFNAGASKGACN